MKKALITFAIAASLTAPALAADRGQGRGNERASDDGLIEIFESQGQCQSRVIQLRNGVRGVSGLNLNGGTTSFVCKLITRGPLEGLVGLFK